VIADLVYVGSMIAPGYNPDVVPANYLEEPPNSIQVVRDNLQLIREVLLLPLLFYVLPLRHRVRSHLALLLLQILNPNEDKHQVQRLIKRLKSEIYPQIDRFISTWRGIGVSLNVLLEDVDAVA
jgi:hypothetical protein